ncbi:peptidase family C50-domain-containing protein [Limtongia smithiae]|uniref:peptidase family C50-domain-containing protein n=1 Tax=Limtongia smithiae TaxID=1125753 RepID=UPI0034CDEE5A
MAIELPRVQSCCDSTTTTRTSKRPPRKNITKFGLSAFNRAIHYVNYVRTAVESKRTALPSPTEFLAHVNLDSHIVDEDFQRLALDIDLLRRTAYKSLANESAEFTLCLLDFVVFYKHLLATSPVFFKVAGRILENAVAFIKLLIQASTDAEHVLVTLRKCAEVSIDLLRDPKSGLYITNACYNYGLTLWRTSERTDAARALRMATDYHRELVACCTQLATAEQSVLISKKLERLALAYIELQRIDEAVTALDDAIFVLVDDTKIAKASDTLSVAAVMAKYPEVDRVLLLLANVTAQLARSRKYVSFKFDNFYAKTRGVLLERLLSVLVAVRKTVDPTITQSIMERIEEVYQDIYPIRLARARMILLPLALNQAAKDAAITLATETITTLQALDFQEDIGLRRFANGIVACLALHIAVLEFQLQRSKSTNLSEAVKMWPRIASSDMAIEWLIGNSNLLSSLLTINGCAKSSSDILHCLHTVLSNSHPLQRFQCLVALVRDNLRLGYTGKADSFVREAYCLITDPAIRTTEVISLHMVEMEYFIATGSLSKARDRLHAIRRLQEKDEKIGHAVLAGICYAASLLLTENGRFSQALAFAKASVKFVKTALQTKDEDGVSNAWELSLSLLQTYAQIAMLYDRQGMVREAEFYFVETTKAAATIHPEGQLHAYHSILLGDFYVRSGSIYKSGSLLKPLVQGTFESESRLDDAVVAMVLVRYYRAIGAGEDALRTQEAAQEALELALKSEDNAIDEMMHKLSLSESSSKRACKALKSLATIERHRARLLREQSILLVHEERWRDAENVLKQAAACNVVPHDWALQHAAEATQQFRLALALLQNDPVFGVLQDSAISIPSVSSTKASGRAHTKEAPLTRTTRRTKAVASASKSKGLADAQMALTKARQFVLESYFLATKLGSVYERQTIANRLARVLLLQSAIGATTRDEMSCPAVNYFFELSKGLSLIKDIPAAVGTFPEDELLETDLSHTSVFDLNEFQAEYVDILPQSWAAISISLCENSENLIISRFEAHASPLLIRLPINRHNSRDPDEESFQFQDALAELRDIIMRNNETTQTSRKLVAQTGSEGNKAEKQKWWSDRRALDARLKDLLTNIEYCWIGGFKGVFGGHPRNQELLARFNASFMAILRKHLPTRRVIRTRQRTSAAAASAKTKDEVKIDPLVLELFIGLGDPEDGDTAEMLEDLIYFVLDILQFHGECNAYDELDMDQIVVDIQEILHAYYADVKRDDCGEAASDIQHVVLVLDKTVHMFPWESMPCLRSQSVSRVPSLGCLRDILQRRATAGNNGMTVDVQSGTYILNPSQDLVNTQAQFAGKLSQSESWTPIIARPPSEPEFLAALSATNIVLYFGHGGGEQYARASSIRGLTNCAPTLLFGCSSGALHGGGCGSEFEPWGTPLNYLVGGCPMLVANLWDVTDKDIDRFADVMLEEWGFYDGEAGEESEGKRDAIGRAMADAREVCTLKYLNGAAPVLYGVPLTIKPRVAELI